MTTEYVQVSQRYPTGTASVFKDPDGNASFTIPRPAAFDDVKLDESMLRRLETVPADWIYFGTLSQAPEQSEQSLAKLIERLPRAKRFYDVNLRKGHWTVRLVQALSRLCTVIKVNEDEAQLLYRLTAGEETFTLKRFSRYWSALHGVETIVITLGGHGCAIYSAGTLTRHVGFAVHVVDTVGAGDAFSSGYMHGMAQGWTLDQIARFANALGATVASRSGATPLWTPTECLQLIATTSL
jgi:fructokinase